MSAPKRRHLALLFAVGASLVATAPSSAPGAGTIEGIHRPALSDLDARTGGVAPSFAQIDQAAALGAAVTWNRFGTPQTLSKPGGFLATGVQGASAVDAARAWLDANTALFRLSSTDGLALYADSKLAQSEGHAVHFKQTFGGLPAAHDGLITIGLTGSAANGWKVGYASSSLTGDTALGTTSTLSGVEAWLRAAANVGRVTSIVSVGATAADREWTVFPVSGFGDLQRVRSVAVPTPTGGVRPAFETLVLDNRGGELTGYRTLVDGASGKVLVRENLVHQSHPATPETFTGSVPPTDGACGPSHGPWTIDAGENVQSIEAAAAATLAANDMVIELLRNGAPIQSGDTATSPEIIHYAPTGGVPAGTYAVRVCDFGDGAPWTDPSTYDGTVAFNDAAGTPGTPDTGIYPPKWRVFPANPIPPALSAYPWNVSSTDIRKLWCWESVVQGSPIAGCDDEVRNLAARVPWDHDPDTDAPTFTTRGNAAISSESWFGPLTPGPTGHMPVSPTRNYSFPWTNEWYAKRCDPTSFVPGVSNDISAAVTNLFGMHNRMHDWSYTLGFDEENWNGQQSNFGGAGAEGDPVLGQAQAGGADGGYPLYLGRDNANMRTLPDGVSSITNMYLWQPIRGSFYAPCVDGDYDMAVIGHEYGHMIENRMIGKGGNRAGHHAGAMGESNGDLNAMEILNEYGLVPVAGENPYAVGAYATGSKERGIRNYGMNDSPLNFSDMGWDPLFSGATPVHNDGEIWSATNFDIRKALIEKYNATHPASDAAAQRKCAEGLKAPEDCPGNRRWIQLVYDAYLLMPTGPTMLEARDAYLAADMMRFGGANQNELWLAFARRGFGEGARATNGYPGGDTDPKPDFASPLHSNATVTFQATAADEGGAPITNARIYVGHYEARVSPIADTDPSTNAGGSGANTLDDTAQLVPGTYEFVAHAPGYGHVRFTQTLTAGSSQTLTISMATNLASSAKGATALGNGNVAALIDDTENTTWTAPGNPSAQQVTVDLAGTTPQTVRRVQVSAMLQNGQNRYTALRKFAIEASTNGITFSRVFTSADDAFPGASPRPLIPNMRLRSFDLPAPVSATHVRLVVLETQCTGQTEFHGIQDVDIANGTDCRGVGEPVGTDPLAASGQTPPPQNTNTRAAELQVFSSSGGASTGATLALSPQSATNVVGTQHCLTATVLSSSNAPIKGKPVRFSVSGANTAAGAVSTNNQGKATYCYSGTSAGSDLISAYADLNGNVRQDNAEPGGTASKTWVPRSTPNCEVKVTGSGEITTGGGDGPNPSGNKASFGGTAKASAAGVPSGSEEYQDRGPVMATNVESVTVASITCAANGVATIAGTGTMDGAPVDYVITVQDAGEPGTGDKYGIELSVGGTLVYDSGFRPLDSGNVQIHK